MKYNIYEEYDIVSSEHHLVTYNVDAESLEEAIRKVKNGKCKFLSEEVEHGDQEFKNECYTVRNKDDLNAKDKEYLEQFELFGNEDDDEE